MEAKFLIGLLLAPWLWYERKRTDALEKKLNNFYSKDEVKEQIELRNKPIIDKLDMIYDEIKRRNV